MKCNKKRKKTIFRMTSEPEEIGFEGKEEEEQEAQETADPKEERNKGEIGDDVVEESERELKDNFNQNNDKTIDSSALPGQINNNQQKSNQRIFPIKSLVNINKNISQSPTKTSNQNNSTHTQKVNGSIISNNQNDIKLNNHFNDINKSNSTQPSLRSSSNCSCNSSSSSINNSQNNNGFQTKSRSSSGSSTNSLISPINNRIKTNDFLPPIEETSRSDKPQTSYNQQMGAGMSKRHSTSHFRLNSIDSSPSSSLNADSFNLPISPKNKHSPHPHRSVINKLQDHSHSNDISSNNKTSASNSPVLSHFVLSNFQQPISNPDFYDNNEPGQFEPEDLLLSSLKRPCSNPPSPGSQSYKALHSSHNSGSTRLSGNPINTKTSLANNHPQREKPTSHRKNIPPTSEEPVSLAGMTHAGISAPNQSSCSDASRCSSPPTVLSDHNAYTTTRFEYQESQDGLLILTGRKNQVTACEDEPIRMPGAIQAFGVLIAVIVHGEVKRNPIKSPGIDPNDPSLGILPMTASDHSPSSDHEGEYEEIVSISRLEVVQVSENSGHILGLPPHLLLNLYSLTEVLTHDQSQTLCDNLEVCLDSSGSSTAGPHTFRLCGKGAAGTGTDGPCSHAEWSCWCATHRPDPVSRPALVVIEFELQHDEINPPSTVSLEPVQVDERGGANEKPYEPTEQDLIESTMSINKPLRALSRLRRKGKDFSGDSVEVLSILTQVNSQFDKAEDMPTFLKMAVGLVRELTGFDRVMIYKFDEFWNGQVLAELVDWKRTRDLYRGLRFPASDIPAQARELYKINRVRMLYDRDQPTARLMCKSEEELQNPLDMTHCHLRAMSPIHIKYLANMGVRASFSISLVMNDQLWGLISCHSYGKFGQRVTFPTRHFCRILGDSVSSNIQRLHLSERLQSRKLINTASTTKNPSGYIVAKAEDLLWLFDAQSGVLSIGEEAKILGTVTNSQEILAILEFLRFKSYDSIQVSTDINQTFPDAQYPGGFESISGLLLIPLSRGGRDFICFFRPAQMKEIHWAGNPHEKGTKDDDNPGVLQPRKSFKIWSETVKERSKSWNDDQLETGSVLSLVYGKFIDVWRQKEAAVQNNQLQALLLSNASHEVRTPLHQILTTLELALDGQLDEDTRDNLSKSYSASRALVHVINDLLDLTKAEQGGDLFSRDPFHLESTIEEAISIHQREAERKALSFELIQDPRGTPAIITGDRARLRQVVSNLVGNAVKHTTQGFIRVQWGYEPEETFAHEDQEEPSCEEIVRVSVTVTDTGKGIPEAHLESIFRAFEQVGSGESDDSACESIGLGLAVVGRVVHNMGGQLRVDSTVDRGSKFTIILPFVVPKSTNSLCSNSKSSQDSSHVRSVISDHTNLPSRTPKTNKLSYGSTHGSMSTNSAIDDFVESLQGRPPTFNSSEASCSPRTSHSRQAQGSFKAGSYGSFHGSKESGSSQSRNSHVYHYPGSTQHQQRSSNSHQSFSDEKEHLVRRDQEQTKARLSKSVSALSTKVADLPRQCKKDTNGDPVSSNNLSSLGDDSIEPSRSIIRDSEKSEEAVNEEAICPLLEARRSKTEPIVRSQAPHHVVIPAPLSPSQTFDNLKPSSPQSVQHISDFQKKNCRQSISKQPLKVMVVEDDPINRLILKKKLTISGHSVSLTVHGQEAIELFERNPSQFDIILMDLQMPICDGLEATRKIRKFEKDFIHHRDSPKRYEKDEDESGKKEEDARHDLVSAGYSLPRSHLVNSGVPIIAVSASLHERQRSDIEEAGMDGWILKPVDFDRLATLMIAAVDLGTRAQLLYQPGTWDRGGWLNPSKSSGRHLSEKHQDISKSKQCA